MSVPSMDFSTWPPMASRLPVIDTMSTQHASATVVGSIRINGAALPGGGAAARLPQFTVPEIVARLSWLNSASGNVTFRSIVTKAFVRPDGGGGDGTGAVMTVLPGRIGALTTATGGGGTKSALPATPPPVIAFASATLSLTALSFAASPPPLETCCIFLLDSPWTIWATCAGVMFVNAAGEIPVARNC